MPILACHPSWACHTAKEHRGAFWTPHTTAPQLRELAACRGFRGRSGGFALCQSIVARCGTAVVRRPDTSKLTHRGPSTASSEHSRLVMCRTTSAWDARYSLPRATARIRSVNFGGVAERLIAPVLKTGRVHSLAGSNPAPSAGGRANKSCWLCPAPTSSASPTKLSTCRKICRSPRRR